MESESTSLDTLSSTLSEEESSSHVEVNSNEFRIFDVRTARKNPGQNNLFQYFVVMVLVFSVVVFVILSLVFLVLYLHEVSEFGIKELTEVSFRKCNPGSSNCYTGISKTAWVPTRSHGFVSRPSRCVKNINMEEVTLFYDHRKYSVREYIGKYRHVGNLDHVLEPEDQEIEDCEVLEEYENELKDLDLKKYSFECNWNCKDEETEEESPGGKYEFDETGYSEFQAVLFAYAFCEEKGQFVCGKTEGRVAIDVNILLLGEATPPPLPDEKER